MVFVSVNSMIAGSWWARWLAVCLGGLFSDVGFALCRFAGRSERSCSFTLDVGLVRSALGGSDRCAGVFLIPRRSFSDRVGCEEREGRDGVTDGVGVSPGREGER